ncbi:unnamed protein product [Diatraea saccharalis]|uniref:Leprecan-like alpha-helical domain-containing protein n=1 Tax=Diatraea saccharalis TaxID=40085 RepID=A0A9N9RHD7_9NEOP|nr:unnamed protein product [Diatraea saccharalis]
MQIMRIRLLKHLLLLIAIVMAECKISSIEKAYSKGVSAYTGERWSECISQFEEALHLYKLYRLIIVNCRLKCKSQPYQSILNTNIEDLKIYEKIFMNKNCLHSCQEKDLPVGHEDIKLDEKILTYMQTRKPYDYLHVCYFQMYALPKAANSAYTYLVANPEDDNMKKNLEYYIDQPEVDVSEIIDLQSEDYEVLYNLGYKSYKQNNWAETIANMEEVITNYISSENMCRAECERQPEQDGSSEFIITVSNNIASLLHCYQYCQKKLSTLQYKSGIEFLADVLNYLQISYYHLDRFDDAAKCVATYLALMPLDEDMITNKEIYETVVDKKSFIERSDVIHYFKRDEYEKKLLNLFHQEDYYHSE